MLSKTLCLQCTCNLPCFKFFAVKNSTLYGKRSKKYYQLLKIRVRNADFTHLYKNGYLFVAHTVCVYCSQHENKSVSSV